MSTDDINKIETALQEESGITLVKQDEIEETKSIPQLTEEEIKKAKQCQICQEKDWIYTCPRCLTHSCSLKCVKKHKEEALCSGERDKTAYVPLQKYTETHMMSGTWVYFTQLFQFVKLLQFRLHLFRRCIKTIR